MMEYSVLRGIQTLTLGWIRYFLTTLSLSLKISQSSSIQRKGRCGRVRPGCCVHLYTESFMSMQREHELPEIMQLSLEKTILQVKNLFPLEDVVELMSGLVEPPDIVQLEQSFARLRQCGAIADKEDDEGENVMDASVTVRDFNLI